MQPHTNSENLAVPAGPGDAGSRALPDAAASSGALEGEAELRARILVTLNCIIDPCSAASAAAAGLVDMGLIRRLDLVPLDGGRWRCEVGLCVTHAFCMMTGIFVNEIERRLSGLDMLADVRVDLDCSTIWTEEFMSQDYRSRLQELRERRMTK